MFSKNVFLALPFIVCALPLHAAEPEAPRAGFSADLRGTQAGSWQSNPLMLAQGEEAIWGSITTLGLVLDNQTPTSSLMSDTQLTHNIFNDNDFNSTDIRQLLDFTKRTQRWSFGLNGSLNHDTTRSSEITSFGLNLPSVRRTALSGSPRIGYRLSPVEIVEVSASAMTTTYDNSAFIDYKLYGSKVGYTRDFTPTDAGTLYVQAQRYSAMAGSRSNVDSVSPAVGWVKKISPRLTSTVSAGLVFAKTEDPTASTKSSERNYAFSGKINYRGEQDNFDFSARRARQPLGNGTETLLTSFEVSNSHAINDLLSLNLEASYRFADTTQTTGRDLESDLRAGVGFAYHLTQTVDFTTNYSYRSEKLTNVQGDIQNNTILVGITYRPL